MATGATWVSRVAEYGDEHATSERNASHVGVDSDIPSRRNAVTPGAEGHPRSESSSGVESTPDASTTDALAEGVEDPPGAASSMTGVGSAPTKLQ